MVEQDKLRQTPPGNDSDKPSVRPMVELRGLTKRYGEVAAVDEVDLTIFAGELFAILGASGSGKTTLLRMLAGFEPPSAGQVLIDGVDMTRVPPYERPVNMMFQSYALFPHMTVAQNVGYGLKKERVDKAEITRRVGRILDLVRMEHLAGRKPDALSGGERQRVALARALVKRPKLLLLDEPLAALDKKLREHTQFELMNLQDELGITFVVVTHDQEEAMTLASRIAVMNHGRFEQVGLPGEVYEYPCNRFVADFVGSINPFEATVAGVEEGHVIVDSPEAGTRLRVAASDPPALGSPCCVAVRPEKILISKTPPEAGREVLKGIVYDLGYFGNLSIYRVKLPSGFMLKVSAQNRMRSATRTVEWDDEVYLSWEIGSAVLLTD